MKHGILIICMIGCMLNSVQAQLLNENCNPCQIWQLFRKCEQVGLGRIVYQKKKLFTNKDLFYGQISTSSLDSFCAQILEDYPALRYQIIGKVAFVGRLDTSISVKGWVQDENANPLPFASVKLKNKDGGIIANEQGEFSITWNTSDILVISYVGYRPLEVPWQNSATIVVSLEQQPSDDAEAPTIKGYLDKNLSSKTGGISVIKTGFDNKTNVLNTLEGRITGLQMNRSSGQFGASTNVSFRGHISIGQLLGVHQLPTSDPLIIVDGVPWAPLFRPANLLPSFLGTPSAAGVSARGIDALILINPSDIESIVVLKDADATAIYGAHGANGVIIVRTKKAMTQEPQLRISGSLGFGRVTRAMDLMNTSQYRMMRREALLNDGITPDKYTAPDLYLWDSTRDINMNKFLLGNTAKIRDAQVSYSSGEKLMRYLIGGSYSEQTTIFPGDLYAKRWSLHGDAVYNSENSKLNVNVIGFAAGVEDNSIPENIMQALLLAPNAPPFRSINGDLNWGEYGISFRNPYSFFNNRYTVNMSTAIFHSNIKYALNENISFGTSFGYNRLLTIEESIIKRSSQDTASDFKGSYASAVNGFRTWTVEPHIKFKRRIGAIDLNALVATSLLVQVNSWEKHNYSGYSNDALLGNRDAAQESAIDTNSVVYRYFSNFGRLQADYKDKYFLNLTLRRDGSSRFGSENQYGNFWAIGGAWAFFRKDTSRKWMPWITAGKIRASYGVTGNDQIGDYGYASMYTPSPNGLSYQGIPGLTPELANPYIQWEINKKFETFIDATFFKEKLNLKFTWYRNRSTSLLLSKLIASQSGANSIYTNEDAIVQNEGFESELNMKLLKKDFYWSCNLTISVPNNKLIAFPNLQMSGYRNSLVIGKSLSVQRVFPFKGINSNGAFQFGSDKYIIGDLDPDVFGALAQNFSCKNISLEMIWEFRVQHGPGYLSYLLQHLAPGMLNESFFVNQTTDFLNHWQKLSANEGSAINGNLETYINSDAIWANSSCARLQKAKLAYNFSKSACKKLNIKNATVYAMGENLLTLTSYKGADPELGDPFVAPLLKVFTIGFQITI